MDASSDQARLDPKLFRRLEWHTIKNGGKTHYKQWHTQDQQYVDGRRNDSMAPWR